MEDFLGQNDDNIVTPESLALKLLIENDVNDYTGVLQMFVDDNNSTLYDKYAGQFEILITIFMEMIYGMLKIEHINSFIDSDGNLDENIDFDSTFKPNFSEYDIKDITKIFQEKFKKIRIYLSIHEVQGDDKNNKNDYGYYDKYYCRTILKDTFDGRTYFWRNRKILDPNKRYTFVLRNDNDKNNKKLDDFYAICVFPHIKIKISFSPINIITKDY